MTLSLQLGRAPAGRGCRKPSLGASASVSALRASIPHACALRLPCLSSRVITFLQFERTTRLS